VPIGYLIRRTSQLVLIVFIASSINFLIPRLIPGDPIEAALTTKIAAAGNFGQDVLQIAEAYRAKFGLDKPLWLQYANYWRDIFRLDLGVSLIDFPQPVVSKVRGALPWTMGLLLTSLVISFSIGSILGALLAWPRGPRFLKAIVPPMMILTSIPFFLLGMILVSLFAVELALFPPAGGFDPTTILAFDLFSIVDIVYHAILPALALILGAIGGWALGMRALMVNILGEDYITFAEAKGLPPRRVFLWYGARNALLPQVTNLAIAMGSIFSGAVLVEAMFGYPGLGGVLFAAIAGKDYFVIQGLVLMIIFALALALFLIDLLYPLVDPRIRYQG
jgi:peptide/nickel transport system permease protein